MLVRDALLPMALRFMDRTPVRTQSCIRPQTILHLHELTRAILDLGRRLGRLLASILGFLFQIVASIPAHWIALTSSETSCWHYL